jgi:uncharacterized protein HemX
MDTIDQNQNPFPPQPAPRSGNIGPLAAAVVIVILLAAAGFYFFYSQQQKQQAEDAAQALQATQAQGDETAAATDSTSDIESDLGATQTSGADADVSNLNDAL